MEVLGIDIGSSSVKAGILRGGRIIGDLVIQTFPTKFDGVRAEVSANDILCALANAIHRVRLAPGKPDILALSVMSPAWLAMDKTGKALTPIITHQDRRSIAIAHKIEDRVGKQRHLNIAGNRPFPGGISSTTFAWFKQYHPELIKKADLIGHLNTLLHRVLTGQRVIDPSNASFTGLYETVKPGGWSQTLCQTVGIDTNVLPEIHPANKVVGRITTAAAAEFGLPAGLPVMTGMVDTSAAMLQAGSQPGQLLNVAGSTDVLALCCARPHPSEHLLCRALGIGKRWLSVATLAAAGSSIVWIKQQMFADMPDGVFYRLLTKLAKAHPQSGVEFHPYLAGSRISIDQKHGSFTGLTLATTRQDMLAAVIAALSQSSANRIALLLNLEKVSRDVFVSGGLQKGLGLSLYRQWPGQWRFKSATEATLRGLEKAVLASINSVDLPRH